MPDLFILVKDCNPQVGNTGKVEVEWCASGSDGNKTMGIVEVAFASSSSQMNTIIEDAAKTVYASNFATAFGPGDRIKLAGGIV